MVCTSLFFHLYAEAQVLILIRSDAQSSISSSSLLSIITAVYMLSVVSAAAAALQTY